MCDVQYSRVQIRTDGWAMEGKRDGWMDEYMNGWMDVLTGHWMILALCS